MKRGGLLYKFAKRCEEPSKKMPWMILHKMYMLFSIIYGEKVYKKIQKDNNGSTILYCYSVSMGDYYWFSLVIDEFFKQYKLDSYVFVVPNSLTGLCESLQFKKIYSVGFMEFCTMNLFLKFCRGGTNSIDFSPWFVFAQAKEYKVVPKISVKNDGPMDIQRFYNLGLEEKNTVLLAPYEKSLSHNGFPLLPQKFWELLAEKFSEMGYKVCTNCANNKSEPPVKDTIPVLPPYGEIFRFCETCGYVVTIRSGFADMCAFSDCKKIVLYPNQKVFSLWSINEYFGKVQGVYELIYYDYLEKLDSLVDCIVKDIINDRR